MGVEECFFCDVQGEDDSNRLIIRCSTFYVRYDDFPVSPGHCEIFPKSHKVSLFELNQDEWKQLYDSIAMAVFIIDKKFHPQGYNFGINEGEAAGQSIPHLHVHVIPRYEGDVENPRGGIRNVLPGGDYTDKVADRIPDRTKYLK